MIKSNVLLNKTQLFIGSLERSHLAESEKVELAKKVLSGEVMREGNIWLLRTQCIFTWKYGQMYVHMTSSKVVHTPHHIRRFLHRALILKMKLNTGQTSGTTAEGKKTNMDKYEGMGLLTVDTLKTFYCCIESPWCRMNPTHFVTKIEKQEITVTHSPHY